MKSKRWIIWSGIALVICLTAAAFSFLSFKAMSSKLVDNSSMVSSTGMTEPIQPIQHAKTGLYVTGESRLAPALQKELTFQLQGDPQFGEIESLTDIENTTENPILWVEIAKKDIFWSPIVARATLNVNVAYASDGDISFRLREPVEFKHSGDQATLYQSGQYTFSDASRGIISSPGYFDYLAREIANAIVKDLKAEKK